MGDVLWSVESLVQKLKVLKALNKKHLQEDGYMNLLLLKALHRGDKHEHEFKPRPAGITDRRHSHSGCAAFAELHCRIIFDYYRLDWTVWRERFSSPLRAGTDLPSTMPREGSAGLIS